MITDPRRTDGPQLVRPTPSVAVAWLAIGSVAAVVGLLFGTLQTVGIVAHEERTERFSVRDPAVAVLDVASDAGRIEVIGADVDEVRITARVSDGITATDFRHEVLGDRLQIRVRCTLVIAGPWCRAGLRIVVPRDLEVKVRSREDEVRVRGLAGRVDAESANGTVEGEALSGPVRLHSGNDTVRATRLRSDSVQADSANGSVHVEFDRPPSSALAHSGNGDVEVVVPRGTEGYDVQIESQNGSTDDQVRTTSTSDRRIVATSNNGDVTVRYLD